MSLYRISNGHNPHNSSSHRLSTLSVKRLEINTAARDCLFLFIVALVIVSPIHGTSNSLPPNSAQDGFFLNSSGSTIRVCDDAPLGGQHSSVSADGNVVVFMDEQREYGGPARETRLVAKEYTNDKRESEFSLLISGSEIYSTHRIRQWQDS